LVRLAQLKIKGYRSIKDECVIVVPAGVPLILIGDNNAGKSNIVRALDVILGEIWPSTREPEDHEFWGRQRDDSIEIEVFWEGLVSGGDTIERFSWTYTPGASPEPCLSLAHTADARQFRPTKPLRQQCLSMVIGADRRLSYQLSYTSKWTLLSKLMRTFTIIWYRTRLVSIV
jgi:putative ATP-dependent endonuclease of OLD family